METFKVPKVVEAGAVPAMIHQVFEVRPSLKYADLSLQKLPKDVLQSALPIVKTLAIWWEPKRGAANSGLVDQRKVNSKGELPQLVQPLVKGSVEPNLIKISYFRIIGEI